MQIIPLCSKKNLDSQEVSMNKFFMFGTCLLSSALLFSNTQSQKMKYTGNQPESVQNKTQELKGFYFGAFGGASFVEVTNTQKGAALYSGTATPVETPSTYSINVNAKGTSPTLTLGMGGLHFGYEWKQKSNKNLWLNPAVEIESYYFAYQMDSFLDNQATPDDIDFHYFENFLPTRNFGYTANLVLALENKYLTPYVAVGFGQQFIWINNAYSEQIEPYENINHFNGNTNANTMSCAVLAKAGFRRTCWDHYRFFAEYRMIYNSKVNFELGPTQPTAAVNHRPTTLWQVGFDNSIFNTVSFGVDFLW